MKVVVNRGIGGFALSQLVFDKLGFEWAGFGYVHNENFGIESSNWNAYRSNPRLIAAIEEVGTEAASGECASLAIIEIPDDIEWYVYEHEDGTEWVHEKHRIW